jgi:hypothetical protein
MRALRDVGRHLVLALRAVLTHRGVRALRVALALAGGLGRNADLILEFELVAVPGELLQTVTLNMLGVGQADRADATPRCWSLSAGYKRSRSSSAVMPMIARIFRRVPLGMS